MSSWINTASGFSCGFSKGWSEGWTNWSKFSARVGISWGSWAVDWAGSRCSDPGVKQADSFFHPFSSVFVTVVFFTWCLPWSFALLSGSLGRSRSRYVQLFRCFGSASRATRLLSGTQGLVVTGGICSCLKSLKSLRYNFASTRPIKIERNFVVYLMIWENQKSKVVDATISRDN